MGDLALTWADGSADLSLVDDDLESDEGLRTAVLLSLYTDRRADDADQLPGNDGDLRGWWADEFLPGASDKFGSRLWLLDRSKMSEGLAEDAELYVREALAWMEEDRVVSEIDYTAEVEGEHLYHVITLHRPTTDPASFRFAHAWTGEASR